jgi:phenylalanine-4-hydroxylase
MMDTPAQPPKLLDILDSDTSTANSAILLETGRQAIVQLDPDHPGFNDSQYRERRNQIAQIAVEYRPGSPVPDAPYTEKEHAVWRRVCDELAPVHQRHACSAYLEYSGKLDLPTDRIPQLQEVSDRIHPLSGFRLEPVGGLVHPKVFLSTLARDVFLSTQYIRHYSAPAYTPEPDVIHELIGHAAQLAHPGFAELNRLFGRAAAAVGPGAELTRVGRVYWYTIEFGVLRERSEVRAFGAGLLSSYGETVAMHEAEIRDLDFEDMESRDYDVTQYQPILYCADSFAHLEDALSSYLIGKVARA